jgi:hypothetical protein
MATATTHVGPAAGAARRRYWQTQVEAQQRSGLSQAAFCRRRGFPKGTFGFWKWKLTREVGGTPHRSVVLTTRPAGTPSFVPIQLTPTAEPRAEEPVLAPDREIEIAFRDGRSVRVRGHVDAAWLVQVLRGLEGPPC